MWPLNVALIHDHIKATSSDMNSTVDGRAFLPFRNDNGLHESTRRTLKRLFTQVSQSHECVQSSSGLVACNNWLENRKSN